MIPGNSLPSKNSSMAPPPVLTKLTFFANFNWLMAATESPPPTMVKPPFLVAAAHALATVLVPLANASISNTPIGPFQITVWLFLMTLANCRAAAGPMSRPIQPSGIWLLGHTLTAASAANLSPQTESFGSSTLTPASFAFFKNSLAVFSLSISTRELPIAPFLAIKKV